MVAPLRTYHYSYLLPYLVPDINHMVSWRTKPDCTYAGHWLCPKYSEAQCLQCFDSQRVFHFWNSDDAKGSLDFLQNNQKMLWFLMTEPETCSDTNLALDQWILKPQKPVLCGQIILASRKKIASVWNRSWNLCQNHSWPASTSLFLTDVDIQNACLLLLFLTMMLMLRCPVQGF